MSRASVFGGGEDFLGGTSASERRKRAEGARALAESSPDGFHEREPKGVDAHNKQEAKAPAKNGVTSVKRKPGRPKGSNKAPTKQFNFHLRADLKELLDEAIIDEMGGDYKSAFMTRLVRMHLVEIGKIAE